MRAARWIRSIDALTGYLAVGALLAGGFAERFMVVAAGCCGCAGAAPVVTPDALLLCGVTSRTPGGTGGGEVCAVLWFAEGVCAVLPAELVDVLFNP